MEPWDMIMAGRNIKLNVIALGVLVALVAFICFAFGIGSQRIISAQQAVELIKARGEAVWGPYIHERMDRKALIKSNEYSSNINTPGTGWSVDKADLNGWAAYLPPCLRPSYHVAFSRIVDGLQLNFECHVPECGEFAPATCFHFGG
jgi:hypothetical protein